MTIIRQFLALLLIAGLCSSCDNPSVEAPAAPQGAIPEHQLRALQQAKDIEGKLLQLDAQRQQDLAK